MSLGQYPMQIILNSNVPIETFSFNASYAVDKKNGMIAHLCDSGAVLVPFALNLVSTFIGALKVRERQERTFPLVNLHSFSCSFLEGKFGWLDNGLAFHLWDCPHHLENPGSITGLCISTTNVKPQSFSILPFHVPLELNGEVKSE